MPPSHYTGPLFPSWARTTFRFVRDGLLWSWHTGLTLSSGSLQSTFDYNRPYGTLLVVSQLLYYEVIKAVAG